MTTRLLHDIGWQTENLSFSSAGASNNTRIWAWNLHGKFLLLDEALIDSLGENIPVADDKALIFESRKIAKSFGYWHPYIHRYAVSNKIVTYLCGWVDFGDASRKRYMNSRIRSARIIEFRAGWDEDLYPVSIIPREEIYPL